MNWPAVRWLLRLQARCAAAAGLLLVIFGAGIEVPAGFVLLTLGVLGWAALAEAPDADPLP